MPRVKKQVVYKVGHRTFHKKSTAKRAAHAGTHHKKRHHHKHKYV